MHTWPQLAYLGISVASLTYTLMRDKDWTEVAGTFFAVGTLQSLLYAGGFYDALLR